MHQLDPPPSKAKKPFTLPSFLQPQKQGSSLRAALFLALSSCLCPDMGWDIKQPQEGPSCAGDQESAGAAGQDVWHLPRLAESICHLLNFYVLNIVPGSRVNSGLL